MECAQLLSLACLIQRCHALQVVCPLPVQCWNWNARELSWHVDCRRGRARRRTDRSRKAFPVPAAPLISLPTGPDRWMDRPVARRAATWRVLVGGSLSPESNGINQLVLAAAIFIDCLTDKRWIRIKREKGGDSAATAGSFCSFTEAPRIRSLCPWGQQSPGPARR